MIKFLKNLTAVHDTYWSFSHIQQGMRWREGAQALFETFFHCHSPELTVVVSFPSSSQTKNKQTKPRLEIPLTLILCSFVRPPLTVVSRNKCFELYFKTLYSICRRKCLVWALPLQKSIGWSNTVAYKKWWCEVSIMSASRSWACSASEKCWKTRCSVITITVVLKLCLNYASDQTPTEN